MIIIRIVDVNSNSSAIVMLIYKLNFDLKCLFVCDLRHLPNISNPSLTAPSTFLLKTTMICDLLSEKAQQRLHTRKLCIRRQFWWCWNHDQHQSLFALT